jgi:hypothetical protein
VRKGPCRTGPASARLDANYFRLFTYPAIADAWSAVTDAIGLVCGAFGQHGFDLRGPGDLGRHGALALTLVAVASGALGLVERAAVLSECGGAGDHADGENCGCGAEFHFSSFLGGAFVLQNSF